jgi:acetyl-CoA acyltransferase
MREAVVVEAVRTPIGRRGGTLSSVHPVDLAAHTLDALVHRAGIDPSSIDDVVWGCVSTAGEQSSNIARWAILAAGWPESVPGTTIDRACGSSQQAIHFAAAAVMSGQCDVVVAGGVESMSRVPIGSTRVNGPGLPRGPRVAARYGDADFNQGIAAELIADKWHLSRSQLDEHSLESHAKAGAAQAEGRFQSEIAPVPLADGQIFSADEGIRPGGSIASLASLKPAFRDDGVITAANSSQISDAASAILIMSAEEARRLGKRPLVRFHSFALVGVDPIMMLTGPIPATERVLARAGLSIDDIGAFEVNEAFASVTLAWLAETGVDRAKFNANGGAIALGHPLGCSGARLMTTLINRMQADGHRFGLQAICEAGGMANATILELVS